MGSTASLPAVPLQPPVCAHLAQALMDSAPLACLSWALQPFLIPAASRMSSGLPFPFGKTNHPPGLCSRLEKNLSHVALWKTLMAKNRHCQESLNRTDRHVVCRLDGATQQLHLACRLPVNPQAQLCHTEGHRGAGARSVWYCPVPVPRPQLACQAMIKSNWIQPCLGRV